VFSAVKMQLGVLRDEAPPDAPRRARLDRVLGLIDTGIRSIRGVTNALRPSLLDDLGLAAALRSLAADFEERTGIAVALAVDDELPALSPDADLALPAVQEALSNVARHAGAAGARGRAGRRDGAVTVRCARRRPRLGGPPDLARCGAATGTSGWWACASACAALGGAVALGEAARRRRGAARPAARPVGGRGARPRRRVASRHGHTVRPRTERPAAPVARGVRGVRARVSRAPRVPRRPRLRDVGRDPGAQRDRPQHRQRTPRRRARRALSRVDGRRPRQLDAGAQYYPDVMVACAPPPDDPYVETEPCVLVEVLSPSTERLDVNVKLPRYQATPSVQAVLVVWQDARVVEVRRRLAPDGPFTVDYLIGQGSVTLPCPGPPGGR
jgi:hypothetical protein